PFDWYAPRPREERDVYLLRYHKVFGADKRMPEATCDIGLIGLAVMGQNLVLNMSDHGFRVAVFNRTTSKVDEFLANEAKGTTVEGAHSVADLCAKLKTPRRVMIMV